MFTQEPFEGVGGSKYNVQRIIPPNAKRIQQYISGELQVLLLDHGHSSYFLQSEDHSRANHEVG
jgi:hypothetical protein